MIQSHFRQLLLALLQIICMGIHDSVNHVVGADTTQSVRAKQDNLTFLQGNLCYISLRSLRIVSQTAGDDIAVGMVHRFDFRQLSLIHELLNIGMVPRQPADAPAGHYCVSPAVAEPCYVCLAANDPCHDDSGAESFRFGMRFTVSLDIFVCRGDYFPEESLDIGWL